MVVEGANGPTTREADEILHDRGIVVVPDILANAGGVAVSYLEWVQDLQSFFWDESEVNRQLQTIMVNGFRQVWDFAARGGRAAAHGGLHAGGGSGSKRGGVAAGSGPDR